MAKKKADPHAESNSHKTEDKVDDDEKIEEESAPKKIAKLKALNEFLLKETIERRKQVDSLAKSNGHLKSELNQSVMDNGLLQSEMNVMTEKAVMLEIEKGLVPVLVMGQMNQLAEERIGALEGEMKRALEEKSDVEKSKSEKEFEIMDLNRRLDELTAKFDEERRVSSRVCDERDEIRSQLDAHIQEVKELKLKVTEAEKTEARFSEEVMELKANSDRLVEENAVNMQRIDLITSEKNLMEENLVESNDQIYDLKRNVDELVEQKKAMEGEKNTHERKNEELQTMVRELTDLIESMKIDEKELLGQITELEKKYSTSSEKEVILKTQIDGLIEEKKETDERIGSLETQKSSIQKDLQDVIEELEHQKLTIKKILQEKTELEDAKILGEGVIVKMKDTMRDLEKKYSSSSENEVIMQTQIDALIQERKETDQRIERLETEKSSVLKDLEDAMKDLEHQKLTIEHIVQEKTELEDAKIQGESEIAKLKEHFITLEDTIADLEKKYTASLENEVIKQNQIDGLIEEKRESDDRIASLETEKISVLKELQDATKDLEHQKLAMEKIVQEKTELENDKIQAESEIVKMKEQLITIQGTSSDNEVILQNKIDDLIVEKNESDQRIESLDAEKRSVLKDLHDVTQELEHQKREMEKIIQEKIELQNAKLQGESEIVKMKEQLVTFQHTSSENEVNLQNQINGLIEEKKERDEKIESLETVKSSVMKDLHDVMQELEHQKLTVEKIVEEKDELENAKIQGESEIVKLKDQLITFEGTSSENEVIMQNKINGLIEEKKERDERIESLETEKSSVMKDLHVVMQELEHQKLSIEQIVQEKNELENAKIQGENEIAKMKDELISLQDTISGLESSSLDQNQKVKQLEVAVNHYQLTIEQIVQEKTELEEAKIQGESEIAKVKEELLILQDTVFSFENSSIDQNQKLKQLEDEVSHYKASFDQATIERDEALKSLQEQEATKADFQHKITTMEKEIEDLHKNLSKTKTELGENVVEKNELEDRCAELTKNVAVLEAKLAEICVEFDETKAKLGFAETNSNRVLNTLKKSLSGIKTRDFDLGNGIEEETKDHNTEVEEIKRAFKEKEIKVEEIQRQLELVQNNACKEKSFWTMVSSATTILAAAAVSVAYVARAN